MKTIIIIPTYNEAATIEETLSQVFAAIHDSHVLIFDSASTDETVAIVKALQKKYKTLHLMQEPQKTGLGSAYLQAMRYALDTLEADVVFEFDADLSHQPRYIPLMLKQLEQADCILGSRYVKGGTIPQNWAFHRKCLSVLGNYIARLILTPKYKDFTSGFRATRATTLKAVLPKAFLSPHYAYKLHLLWLLHEHKARIMEFPIVFVDREAGESKLPKNSIIDSLRVILTLRFQKLERYLKMCSVGAVGAFIQIGSYNLLRTSLPLFYAAQISTLFAIINNFILNHRFTFKERQSTQALRRFPLFMSYSILMIYFQSYWLSFWTTYYGTGMLKENCFLGLAMGVGSLLNYLVYDRFIWPIEPLSHE